MNRSLHTILGFCAGMLALLSADRCRADGFIIVDNPPAQTVAGHFAFAPLEVTYHHVAVSINDHTATTTVDQEFFLFPIRRTSKELIFSRCPAKPSPPLATWAP
ncbi:MAG TPA: hypothetical protein VG326_11525 [Tepidisphaeraceae bacterium]|jgi:hypothetical protein|nr:hypothetical protein [Tepidisphaeraceae bacterium]